MDKNTTALNLSTLVPAQTYTLRGGCTLAPWRWMRQSQSVTLTFDETAKADALEKKKKAARAVRSTSEGRDRARTAKGPAPTMPQAKAREYDMQHAASSGAQIRAALGCTAPRATAITRRVVGFAARIASEVGGQRKADPWTAVTSCSPAEIRSV